MTVPVLLHGALATHRRGKILQEALAATLSTELPDGHAAVLAFAEAFQVAEGGEQARLIEWTRTPGHLLLLLPPFAAGACERPVSWRAERMESAPRGGEGLAKVLAPEVAYRLTGELQTPAVPGATWSDLSIAVGSYRLHPAAGLFAVTCLPLWSLAVLDAPSDLESWFTSLVSLVGESRSAEVPVATALLPDHYGFLVFLLSQSFADEEQAIAGLLEQIASAVMPSGYSAFVGKPEIPTYLVGSAAEVEAFHALVPAPNDTYCNLFWPLDDTDASKALKARHEENEARRRAAKAASVQTKHGQTSLFD